MKKSINFNVIGVVKSDGGEVTFDKIEIRRYNSEIINLLEAMLNNPNQTLMDLQSSFEIDMKEKLIFRYCLPHEYDVSYLNSTSYPTFKTFAQYKELIDQKREETYSRHSANQIIKVDVDKLAEEKIGLLEKGLKHNFYIQCYNYCLCYNYYKTLKQLESQTSIKMHTTEDIGWSNFSFKINNDLTITISTNFGYGSSSYFTLGMIYKDIRILPYKLHVNYFYAEMSDLISYLRRYYPRRDSWNSALSFVEKVCNLAIKDEEAFLREFVIEEVNQLMVGLRNIQRTDYGDKAIVEKIINNISIHDSTNNESNVCDSNNMENYISVRNINYGETEYYKLYPKEFGIAHKVEKISTTLQFIDNLTQFSSVFSELLPVIDEIKQINKELQPEIIENIKNISSDIDSLNKKIEIISEEITDIEKKLKPFKSKISLLKEDINKIKSTHKDNKEINEIDSKIKQIRDDKIKEIDSKIEKIQGDKSYKDLTDKMNKKNNQINENRSDICHRDYFLKKLKTALTTISEYLLAA